MRNWISVLKAVIATLFATNFPLTGAEDITTGTDDMDSRGKNSTIRLLRVAWLSKPPYLMLSENNSLDELPYGLLRDTLSPYIVVNCGRSHKPQSITYTFEDKGNNFRSESELVEILRRNEADVVAPIFEIPDDRQYKEFHFVKVDSYPGTDFITTDQETKALKVVLSAIFESWPLLVVAVNFTAITGIIMWALDKHCNSEEFSPSFIKGSGDGIWWSFISMTTVGYGDKVPKSMAARIFSIFWILIGIVVMTLFMANITSALTTVTLETEPASISNLKVAVLGNGTEYQHALHEGTHPEVYHKIDDMIQSVRTQEVNGMLLDHYTASHFQLKGKLESLVTVKKLEFRRDIGVLFSKESYELVNCLKLIRANIWRSVKAVTETLQQTQPKSVKIVRLFNESNRVIKFSIYISFGILLTLMIMGVIWEIKRKKARSLKIKGKHELAEEGSFATKASTRLSINNNLEAARELLLQMQERFNNLEAEVNNFSA